MFLNLQCLYWWWTPCVLGFFISFTHIFIISGPMRYFWILIYNHPHLNLLITSRKIVVTISKNLALTFSNLAMTFKNLVISPRKIVISQLKVNWTKYISIAKITYKNTFSIKSVLVQPKLYYILIICESRSIFWYIHCTLIKFVLGGRFKKSELFSE